ncbi:MAG: hypothetical protein ACOCRK_04365 [bacterium]
MPWTDINEHTGQPWQITIHPSTVLVRKKVANSIIDLIQRNGGSVTVTYNHILDNAKGLDRSYYANIYKEMKSIMAQYGIKRNNKVKKNGPVRGYTYWL